MDGPVGPRRSSTSRSASGTRPRPPKRQPRRRLGGLHRRKKKSVAAIYGFGGLRTIADNLALLETAAIETLAIENSIARNRALAGMAATGAKLIELGELAERVAVLEAALDTSRGDHQPGPSDRGLLGG
jgi:hypothetical protein